jgi:SagB-type dehydrogenase family enzyme
MENATQLLHRLTSVASFDPDRVWDAPVDDPRVVRDLIVNDLTRFPWFFKRYEDSLSQVPLPRGLPTTAASTMAVLAGTAEVGSEELDLSQLSRLLHLSAGVVRTADRPRGPQLFRAAGSAGGRFPLEVYVAVPEGQLLPPGTYWYHPYDHALVNVGPSPRGTGSAVVVTGVPWRTGWRYRERGYRHLYWDAGTMLSQLLAAAESAGIAAHLYSVFPDASVAALVGADGIHEFPVAVVGLGDGPPALDATGPAAGGDVDAAPLEFPLVTAAQRAGERGTLGHPWSQGDPVTVGVQAGAPVEAVVLARGSQRLMDPNRGLPESLLRTSLDVALRGVDVAHFVVVHDVDSLTPGLYRWPHLSTPVRSGPMREELYRVCMDQCLASDAAFVVIAAADVSALDDHQYRDAHLAAGIVEGRLHLAAYALGASASGMTFVDSKVPAVLGEPLDGLLFTCVGVPEYASTAGGPPGSPVAIRSITPRMDTH